MKLSSPLSIDLLTFFKTGEFDYLKIGQSKEWILNNFPDPDGSLYNETILKSSIWFYGDIELHFDEQGLFLIFSERIADLDGGPSLTLNKWILSEPSKLSLIYVTEQLNMQRIDYIKRSDNFGVECIRIAIVQSGVELTFSGEEKVNENPNTFMLTASSLIKK